MRRIIGVGLEAGVAQWDKLVREFPEGWLLLVELWSVCVRDPRVAVEVRPDRCHMPLVGRVLARGTTVR